MAAPSIDRFDDSWIADGVMITATEANGDVQWMTMLNETAAWNDCTLATVQPYDDGMYVGVLHHYTDCARSTTQAVVVAAADRGLNVDVIVEIQMQDIDFEAVAGILDSFTV